MNKKQILTLWVGSILVLMILLSPPKEKRLVDWFGDNPTIISHEYDKGKRIVSCITITIIGITLFVILSDKNYEYTKKIFSKKGKNKS